MPILMLAIALGSFEISVFLLIHSLHGVVLLD